MDPELEKVGSLLAESRDPEDLFGVEPVVLPPRAQLEKREGEYRAFKAVTSAAYLSPDDLELARDLDGRLEALYEEARSRISAGTYNLPGRGVPVPPTYGGRSFEVGTRRYSIGSRLAEGHHSTLYNGYVESGGAALGSVVLKVARSPAESVFVEREANALSILRREDYREISYLPWPIDRFETGGRMGLVLRRIEGFDLEQVRRYPPYAAGLDPRDMAWMMSRTLAVAGLAHRYGVVHGRICPRHVMIEPATHLGVLVGWGGCALAPAQSGQRVLDPIPHFSAPEADGPTAGPWTDVYSIGATYRWLLGFDPEAGGWPASVEPRLASFLEEMVREDPLQRPDDCWSLFERFGELKRELWGKPQWRHLDMPPPGTPV